MIFKANSCLRSPWKAFFFACRTAVKSLAGLETAEFILPCLVCDRICFGSDQEFHRICRELRLVLESNSDSSMPINERRKAVGAVLQVIDTLKFWAEQEIEESCRIALRPACSRNGSSSTKTGENISGPSTWCPKQAMLKIGEFVDEIPLLSQAKAASLVGMHATAAKLLECHARQSINTKFFESTTISGYIDDTGSILQHEIELSLQTFLAKKVYANLNDFETAGALNQDPFLSSPLLDVDGIKAKEAEGKYELALQDYERALQATELNEPDKEAMANGVLNCLVELGRFENILSTLAAKYLSDQEHSRSFAIEAAWRLGKWDALSTLFEEEDGSMGVALGTADSAFRTSIGKAVFSLRNENETESFAFLRDARDAVMANLSIVATESYAKSYRSLVRLHEISEIEDAIVLLSQKHDNSQASMISMANEQWAWDGRLLLTTARAASSILNTRLAIAQLGDDKMLETSLLLQIGRHARKNGLTTVAESSLCKAEACLVNLTTHRANEVPYLHLLLDQVRTNYAKLKRESGENSLALKILGKDSTETAFKEMQFCLLNRKKNLILKQVAAKHERIRFEKMLGVQANVGDDDALADRFARRLLRLTEWTVDGGMHDGAIFDRFKLVIELSSKWEKGKTRLSFHPFLIVELES
jgi:tetratricopeptide (TPR) repeat protein